MFLTLYISCPWWVLILTSSNSSRVNKPKTVVCENLAFFWVVLRKPGYLLRGDHNWSSCSQSLRILSNGRSCHGHQTTAPGHTYEVEMFQRPILRRSFVRRHISVLMFLYHENIVVNSVNKKELRNMMRYIYY